MLNKQDSAFPEVAILRKGTPKKVTVKDNRKIEIMGEDLGAKMRLHFQPGTESIQSVWDLDHAKEKTAYSDKYVASSGDYVLTSIRAVVPAVSVWSAWDYANEVYQAGARLGLADDEHWIYLRDPLDRNHYLIKDGEPFRPFIPGETINYERDGKRFELPVKCHGRLRLVLSDLMEKGELVQITLKTTSYYDCLNIKAQLAGIQGIANIVNRGNAGGVIFQVYRSQQEVTWNKPDGGAMRVKKFFYNLRADPEWVKTAFAKMTAHSLDGEAITRALLPGTDITGPVDPEAGEEEEPEPGGNVVEGQVVESKSKTLPRAAVQSSFIDPPMPEAPPEGNTFKDRTPPGKPAGRPKWTKEQLNALIRLHLAPSEIVAAAMLDLSDLPGNATPTLCQEWGSRYRKVRPMAATKADPSTVQAANKANDWYAEYRKNAVK